MKTFLAFGRIWPYILDFVNFMNYLQWTTFFLSEHLKNIPMWSSDRVHFTIFEDFFFYTTNLHWSLEWSLIRYVYSFGKDVLNMCQIFLTSSSHLWWTVWTHFLTYCVLSLWMTWIYPGVCYTKLLSIPFQWMGERQLNFRQMSWLILEDI